MARWQALLRCVIGPFQVKHLLFLSGCQFQTTTKHSPSPEGLRELQVAWYRCVHLCVCVWAMLRFSESNRQGTKSKSFQNLNVLLIFLHFQRSSCEVCSDLERFSNCGRWEKKEPTNCWYAKQRKSENCQDNTFAIEARWGGSTWCKCRLQYLYIQPKKKKKLPLQIGLKDFPNASSEDVTPRQKSKNTLKRMKFAANKTQGGRKIGNPLGVADTWG